MYLTMCSAKASTTESTAVSSRETFCLAHRSTVVITSTWPFEFVTL
ncbi:hypothetical protein MtrunA17_Chr8g0368971 [Medicago truncatula]|uniref:Uncharacterized protein n=1 Tax=Medicago truncatula TaxID=3880 RepID=A0A396GMG0_MEDTR|nr:hypothetical protein MtrunA17_Chr8g0368971 [Medicago truncatula]